MLGLLVLAFATAWHIAMLVVGRWSAGVLFGRASLADAWRPPSDTRPSALARAIAGVGGWYLAAALLATFGLRIGGSTHIDDASMRLHVIPGGPADRAGIRDGDRIVSVDGAPVRDWDALKTKIHEAKGDVARVEVERSGERLVLEPAPVHGRIQVVPPMIHEDVGFGSALATGLALPAKVVFATGRAFARSFAGKDPPELTGPVGIVAETDHAARSGLGASLRLAAVLGAYSMPVIALASLAVALARGRRAKTVETEGKSQ